MKKIKFFFFTAIALTFLAVNAQNKDVIVDGWKVSEFVPGENDDIPIVSKKANINRNSVSQVSEKLKPFQGVFVSTPYGDLWTKIKISGTNVKIWNALPSSGSWGDADKECGLKEIDGVVRIAEERSNADGSKYYYIYTSSDCGITYYINYFPTKTQKFSFQVGQSRAYSLRKVQESYNPWN